MQIINQARGYAYLYGILKSQQNDPYCRSCNAFVKTLMAIRDNLTAFETHHAEDIKKLPDQFLLLFFAAKDGIAQIHQPENPVSQKKAGNCKLPEGVCFMKTSLTILQKI